MQELKMNSSLAQPKVDLNLAVYISVVPEVSPYLNSQDKPGTPVLCLGN